MEQHSGSTKSTVKDSTKPHSVSEFPKSLNIQDQEQDKQDVNEVDQPNENSNQKNINSISNEDPIVLSNESQSN